MKEAISISEFYIAQQQGRLDAARRSQPKIGDVSLDVDLARTEESDPNTFKLDFSGFKFDFGDLFGQLEEAVKLLWENITSPFEALGEALGLPDLAEYENWVTMFEKWHMRDRLLQL